MTENSKTWELVAALRPISRRLNTSSTFSPGKMGILGHLAVHGRATTTELAAVIRVSPQAVSLAARELEAMGLLERLPDTEDRRRTWIELTEAGRQRLARERAVGLEWLETAISTRLTADERKALEAVIPLLQKLDRSALND